MTEFSRLHPERTEAGWSWFLGLGSLANRLAAGEILEVAIAAAPPLRGRFEHDGQKGDARLFVRLEDGASVPFPLLDGMRARRAGDPTAVPMHALRVVNAARTLRETERRADRTRSNHDRHVAETWRTALDHALTAFDTETHRHA